MDQRRRAALLAASGAIIAASPVILSGHANGPSADFWRGFPIGMAIVLIIAAAVLLKRSKNQPAE
jgi:hypothetical protein